MQALFDNAPLIHDAHKRAHPLDFEYQKAGTVEKSSYTDVLQLVPKAVQRAIDKTSGDVLVFLVRRGVIFTMLACLKLGRLTACFRRKGRTKNTLSNTLTSSEHYVLLALGAFLPSFLPSFLFSL